ncbi:MAG TPA: isoprenylcysteine carboxylmethyltransferase family protein [Gemmatirosa sp.]
MTDATDAGTRSSKSWLQRARVPLGFAVGGLYLWLARPNPTTLGFGAAIALAGVIVRAWAAGHIVKNGRLATTGPYAHTRNPLYVGSFLIACGFAVMATPLLLLVVVAFWAAVYGPVMQREAEHVRALHTEAYDEWAGGVPMFVPRVTPWRGDATPHASRFDPQLYLYHREWQAGLVYVLAVVWMTFRVRRGF